MCQLNVPISLIKVNYGSERAWIPPLWNYIKFTKVQVCEQASIKREPCL